MGIPLRVHYATIIIITDSYKVIRTITLEGTRHIIPYCQKCESKALR